MQIRAMESNQTEDKITVLDAMKLVASAWSKVTPETIQNCYRKAGWITVENEEIPAEVDEYSGNQDLRNYMEIDDDVITSRLLSDAEIEEMVNFDFDEQNCQEEHLEESFLNESSHSNSDSLSSQSNSCMQDLEKILLAGKTSPETFKRFFDLRARLN